ncbi:hypothetical protein HK098_005492 [Nowakowskiella sp. JEL0407]|nr:hypothetical protein HK098_005492 [Nowakowskiella sp. JEL0407]
MKTKYFVIAIESGYDTDHSSQCDFSDTLSDAPPEDKWSLRAKPPSKLLTDISNFLKDVRPGRIPSFTAKVDPASTTLPFSPVIEINGFGIISLPLVESQAMLLWEFLSKLSRANEVMNVDENSWKLLPSQFKILNFSWNDAIRDLIRSVGKKLEIRDKKLKFELKCLGIRGPGSSSPMKLVSEVESNCITLLSIHIPSIYEGGQVVILEKDGTWREENVEGNHVYPSYSLRYVDENFELKTIQNGFKVELIYAIAKMDAAVTPKVKNVNLNSLAILFKRLEMGKFVYMCKHSYKTASITSYGVDALKGIDRARFQAMNKANQLLPENKRLQFYICLSSRFVSYGHCESGNISDEDNNDSGDDDVDRVQKDMKSVKRFKVESEDIVFRTWYCADGTLMSKLPLQPTKITTSDVLNPDGISYSKMWGKTHSNTYSVNSDGDEEKISEYRRHSIVAWPVAHDLYFMSENIDQEVALKYGLIANADNKVEFLNEALKSLGNKKNSTHENDRLAILIIKEIVQLNNEPLAVGLMKSYLENLNTHRLAEIDCFDQLPIPHLIALAEAFQKVEAKLTEFINERQPASAFWCGVQFCLSCLLTETPTELARRFLSISLASIPQVDLPTFKKKNMKETVRKLPLCLHNLSEQSLYTDFETNLKKSPVAVYQFLMNEIIFMYNAEPKLPKSPYVIGLFQSRMQEILPLITRATAELRAKSSLLSKTSVQPIRFPYAVHPDPQVQAFLRSEVVRTTKTFQSKKSAYAFATCVKQYGFKANFVVGDNNTVTITKINKEQQIEANEAKAIDKAVNKETKKIDALRAEWERYNRFIGEGNPELKRAHEDDGHGNHVKK